MRIACFLFMFPELLISRRMSSFRFIFGFGVCLLLSLVSVVLVFFGVFFWFCVVLLFILLVSLLLLVGSCL